MTATMTNITLKDMIHQQYLLIALQRDLTDSIDNAKETFKSRVKAAVNTIFDCSRENPYNLPADIQSKMYLY